MRRSGNRMLFLAFSILLSTCFVNCSDFFNYYTPFRGIVDEGAAKTCFMLKGTLTQVNANTVEKGYKCSYTANVWTKQKNAEEFCASNAPYPVVRGSSVSMNNGKTKCSYHITLFCTDDWWQIDGFCYKAIQRAPKKYSDAKKHCEALNYYRPKLAEFYSTSLGMYLEHMMFSEAWVTVPDITEYFLDGVGEAALFVNDGSFKYDTKQGTLILAELDEKHPFICQYTPEMTMAEVYRKAAEYSEVYPFYVHDNGINVPTSSYLTIHQTDTVTKTVDGKTEYLPKFDTKEIRERCMALGKVIDVESFPLLAIESEWNTVKDSLKDHRFYLTSAFKNDSCALADYHDSQNIPISVAGNAIKVCNAFSFSFNTKKRAPSMAGMRAPSLCTLHSFVFDPAPCPSDWISWQRNAKNKFCHKVFDKAIYEFHEAEALCSSHGAALSGFDNQGEIDAVRAHMNPMPDKYRKEEITDRTLKMLSENHESHYWLGGVIPCETDCVSGALASWNEGVARNTSFLNNYNHKGYGWSAETHTLISYRYDNNALHSHHLFSPEQLKNSSSQIQYRRKHVVCGKYSGQADKKIGGVLKNAL